MTRIKEYLVKQKKIVIIVLVVGIVIGGLFGARTINQDRLNHTEEIATVILTRGPLSVYVVASGTVTSKQTAVLKWQTSGEIEAVTPLLGQSVTAGDLLASLDKTSLSPISIMAQANLISAQKSLDDLMLSEMQQARALKDLENAQRALEDARDPSKLQADAQLDLAQKALVMESAQRRFDILTTPPSEMAIKQSYANKILAEQALNDLKEQIDRFERKARQTSISFLKEIYQNIYEGLQLQWHPKLARYNDQVEKYLNLTSPPDPLDLLVTQADLATAQAQYSTALLSWERIKDGISDADFAILEAVYSDSYREWERVKDGPTDQDIAAAQAQITAAQAAIDQIKLSAPFDGIVTQISAQPGDNIDAGTLAFRIDDLDMLLVTLQVSEMAIGQVFIDQDVLLMLDAVFAKTYHGVVVDISPVGIEVAGAVNFKVIVSFTDSDQAVRPGMTVDVDLLTHQLEDALLVLNQAVHWLDGKQVVYVLGNAPPSDPSIKTSQNWLSVDWQGKSIYPVEIGIGMKSDSYSEVVTGEVNAGDEILLSLPTGFPID